MKYFYQTFHLFKDIDNARVLNTVVWEIQDRYRSAIFQMFQSFNCRKVVVGELDTFQQGQTSYVWK